MVGVTALMVRVKSLMISVTSLMTSATTLMEGVMSFMAGVMILIVGVTTLMVSLMSLMRSVINLMVCQTIIVVGKVEFLRKKGEIYTVDEIKFHGTLAPIAAKILFLAFSGQKKIAAESGK